MAQIIQVHSNKIKPNKWRYHSLGDIEKYLDNTESLDHNEFLTFLTSINYRRCIYKVIQDFDQYPEDDVLLGLNDIFKRIPEHLYEVMFLCKWNRETIDIKRKVSDKNTKDLCEILKKYFLRTMWFDCMEEDYKEYCSNPTEGNKQILVEYWNIIRSYDITNCMEAYLRVCFKNCKENLRYSNNIMNKQDFLFLKNETNQTEQNNGNLSITGNNQNNHVIHIDKNANCSTISVGNTTNNTTNNYYYTKENTPSANENKSDTSKEDLPSKRDSNKYEWDDLPF